MHFLVPARLGQAGQHKGLFKNAEVHSVSHTNMLTIIQQDSNKYPGVIVVICIDET